VQVKVITPKPYQRLIFKRCTMRISGHRKDAAAILDSRTLQSTPESGSRADYDGAKRRKGRKVHQAVDALGLLLALRLTAASEDDRAQVAQLAEQVQAVTAESVEIAYLDQAYTGENAADLGIGASQLPTLVSMGTRAEMSRVSAHSLIFPKTTELTSSVSLALGFPTRQRRINR
jgi:hypothetical protein